MKRLPKLLVGASALALLSGGGAHAIPNPPCPPDDFSSNIAFPDQLDPGTAVVQGILGCPADKDYFTFTGLDEGDSFWLTFFDEEIVAIGDISDLKFSIDGVPLAQQPGLGGTEMVAGIVPQSGALTIGVEPGNAFVAMEGYVVTLEIHDVPEPAGLALFGFGLAGIGFARRRGHI